MSAFAPENENQPSQPPPKPPEAWDPLIRLAGWARRPIDRFLQIEAASGILLLFAAAIALFGMNSPWADSYRGFFLTPIGLHIGPFAFARSLEWFINDGLMVIFFLSWVWKFDEKFTRVN